jgi:hypothetical protein
MQTCRFGFHNSTALHRSLHRRYRRRWESLARRETGTARSGPCPSRQDQILGPRPSLYSQTCGNRADALVRIPYVVSSPAESMLPGAYDVRALIRQGGTAVEEHAFVNVQPAAWP